MPSDRLKFLFVCSCFCERLWQWYTMLKRVMFQIPVLKVLPCFGLNQCRNC